ncbi:hypothetical protein LTR95_015495 [Oleoguttula sp. CCFEE 5521]
MPADRLLGTLLRSLQTYAEQQDTPRLLGTAASLLTTLNNPLNVTLLTSQLLAAPAIWARPEGLTTSLRCMSVFHSAARALVQHEVATSQNQKGSDFVLPQPERVLHSDEWIKAVLHGADNHSPRWRHVLVIGGLLLGFGQAEDRILSRSTFRLLEETFVKFVNNALVDVADDDELGQTTVTLVLNHCFPAISEFERSQLDYDRLLPLLMWSSLRSDEGLGSGYFLGAIDLDLHSTPDNLLGWPERSPSFSHIQRMSASPLGASLGPLARLIGHTVDHVRDSWLVSSAVDDLFDFTRTLQLQWRQTKLSGVDASDEMTSLTRQTLEITSPALWKLLRSASYAVVIILRSVLGRLLSDGALASGEVGPETAAKAISALRNLYFVSARAGAATFTQYTFVYLTALDVLGSHPVQVQRFIEAIRSPHLGTIPQHPLDRNLDLFYLNTAEHLALAIPELAAEDLLVAACKPYLVAGREERLLPSFEAAHSTMLAAFSVPHNAGLAGRHMPFYIDALLRMFPGSVSPRQFRLAFTTLVSIASPPSLVAATQPMLPAVLFDLLQDRVDHASSETLPSMRNEDSQPDAASEAVSLSERAAVVLTAIDTLTSIPLDMLSYCLPATADMVNTIDDSEIRDHCIEHLWSVLMEGAMEPDRSRTSHAWWSSAGGREHVLYGRGHITEHSLDMSGALPEDEISSKLLELDTLFGLPIEGTIDDSIDAFRHQIPDYTDQQTYYLGSYGPYSARTLYYTNLIKMEDKPIVIGSKSFFAQHSKKGKAIKAVSHRPKPVTEMVQVTQGGSIINKMPLTLLTRFSRVAKTKWPKPALVKSVAVPHTSKDVAVQSVQITEGEKFKPADKTDAQPSASQSRTWADMAEDNQNDISDLVAVAKKDPGGETVDAPASIAAAASAPNPAVNGLKSLDLFLEGVDQQPNPASFRYVMRWMDLNKNTRHDEPLAPFSADPLNTVKLEKLVDVYAACLTFDVCPFPHVLYQHVLQRITQSPTSLEDSMFISYRLPLDDIIITRMLTAHFEHAAAETYPEGVAAAIEDFVKGYDQDEDYLLYWNRFSAIKKSYNYKRKQERKHKAQNEKLEALRDAFKDFAGPDALLDTPAVQTTSSDKQAPKILGADKPDGRRHCRRAQQHNGHEKQEAQQKNQALGQLPWVIKPPAKSGKGSLKADVGEVGAKTKAAQ